MLIPHAFAAVPTTNPSAKVDQDTVTVDAKTDTVIRGALKYLAAQQLPSGSWARDSHQAAITGYVLIAYLAAGELPDEGEYGKNVSKGTQFLLDCVGPDGYIAARSGPSNMYGHGIATIALAEIYGQTKDPAVRAKLEKAVRLIVSCQNDEGGWRYAPRQMDGDISVTVLQVVALRAAKDSGLDVPQESVDRAVRFIKSCHDDRTGGFNYQPHTHQPGFARTAAAIYSLQVCGLYDDPWVARGSEYLRKHREERQYWTYGNFYAAPAQYMIGGDTWRDWYTSVHDMLMKNVRQDASGSPYWTPLDGQVNSVYATAVYTTILAMPYHYLPLYQR